MSHAHSAANTSRLSAPVHCEVAWDLRRGSVFQGSAMPNATAVCDIDLDGSYEYIVGTQEGYVMCYKHTPDGSCIPRHEPWLFCGNLATVSAVVPFIPSEDAVFLARRAASTSSAVGMGHPKLYVVCMEGTLSVFNHFSTLGQRPFAPAFHHSIPPNCVCADVVSSMLVIGSLDRHVYLFDATRDDDFHQIAVLSAEAQVFSVRALPIFWPTNKNGVGAVAAVGTPTHTALFDITAALTAVGAPTAAPKPSLGTAPTTIGAASRGAGIVPIWRRGIERSGYHVAATSRRLPVALCGVMQSTAVLGDGLTDSAVAMVVCCSEDGYGSLYRMTFHKMEGHDMTVALVEPQWHVALGTSLLSRCQAISVEVSNYRFVVQDQDAADRSLRPVSPDDSPPLAPASAGTPPQPDIGPLGEQHPHTGATPYSFDSGSHFSGVPQTPYLGASVLNRLGECLGDAGRSASTSPTNTTTTSVTTGGLAPSHHNSRTGGDDTASGAGDGDGKAVLTFFAMTSWNGTVYLFDRHKALVTCDMGDALYSCCVKPALSNQPGVRASRLEGGLTFLCGTTEDVRVCSVPCDSIVVIDTHAMIGNTLLRYGALFEQTVADFVPFFFAVDYDRATMTQRGGTDSNSSSQASSLTSVGGRGAKGSSSGHNTSLGRQQRNHAMEADFIRYLLQAFTPEQWSVLAELADMQGRVEGAHSVGGTSPQLNASYCSLPAAPPKMPL